MSLHNKRKALSNFVANELNGLATAGSSGDITLGQLSPESQALVRILASDLKDVTANIAFRNPGVNFTADAFNLLPDTQIQLDALNGGSLRVKTTTGTSMQWTLSGAGTTVSITSKPSPNQTLTPPLLRPSAGNS